MLTEAHQTYLKEHISKINLVYQELTVYQDEIKVLQEKLEQSLKELDTLRDNEKNWTKLSAENLNISESKFLQIIYEYINKK